jgi:hypothetical protein
VLERVDPIPPKDLVPGTQGVFNFPPWKDLKDEWNGRFPRDDRWRSGQPGNTAEKMFRDAFANGYRAVTGREYHPPKFVTTREEMHRASEALKERLANSLESQMEKYGNQPVE